MQHPAVATKSGRIRIGAYERAPLGIQLAAMRRETLWQAPPVRRTLRIRRHRVLYARDTQPAGCRIRLHQKKPVVDKCEPARPIMRSHGHAVANGRCGLTLSQSVHGTVQERMQTCETRAFETGEIPPALPSVRTGD